MSNPVFAVVCLASPDISNQRQITQMSHLFFWVMVCKLELSLCLHLTAYNYPFIFIG